MGVGIRGRDKVGREGGGGSWKGVTNCRRRKRIKGQEQSNGRGRNKWRREQNRGVREIEGENMRKIEIHRKI